MVSSKLEREFSGSIFDLGGGEGIISRIYGGQVVAIDKRGWTNWKKRRRGR